MMTRFFLAAGLLCCCVAPALVAQQLTPRDAFWSASDLVSVSSNPGAKAARPSQKSPAPSMKPRDTTRPSAQTVAQNGYGAQPHMVHTDLRTQQLGMRYSILLQGADGTYAEASPEATFHSGDHVRLSIMSNEPGYLYVIQQGSSGNWSPMFPIPNSGPDSNRVEPGSPYQIPGGSNAFKIDEHPGMEKLFVVLSREPIRDLDAALQRLKNPASAPSAESSPRPPDRGQTLEASNHIPDDLVQRLASRDLVLVAEQKVEDAPKASSSGEKAVYVVAKQDKDAPIHEVVTRITLNHQ
jgi:hypothetical protein